MRIVDFEDMEFHMKQWGRWMRDRSMIDKLNYARCDNLQKLRGMGGVGPPQIADDDAILIMRALEELRESDRELASIADDFFRLQHDQGEIANRYDVVNRQTVRKRLDLAITWVWGYIARESKVKKRKPTKTA